MTGIEEAVTPDSNSSAEAVSAPEAEGSSENLSLREAWDRAVAERDGKEPEALSREAKAPAPKAEAKELADGETEKTAPLNESSWEKRYKDTQAEFTKSQQALAKLQKEIQEEISPLRTKAEQYEAWDKLLRGNPKLTQLIEETLTQGQVDPDLKQDPIFPIIQQIAKMFNERISPLEKQYTTDRKTREEQEINQLIERGESAVREQYKAMFEKDISEADLAKALKIALEEKIDPTPAQMKRIAQSIFFTEYVEHARQKALSENLEKKRVASKVSNLSSQKSVQPAKEFMSFREAFDLAKQEHSA